MKRTKKNTKVIHTGRKPLWNSQTALFLNGATKASFQVESSLGRYDIFAPVAEGEDLFQMFDPEEKTAEVGAEEFEQVLMGLLEPSPVSV